MNDTVYEKIMKMDNTIDGTKNNAKMYGSIMQDTKISDKLDYVDDASMSPNSLKSFPEDKGQEAMAKTETVILDKQHMSKASTHKPDYGERYEKREHSNSLESGDSPRLSGRKVTARRQLLCSIYTKHKPVGRSFSFVAGEKPPVYIRFPRVYNKDERDKQSKETATKERAVVKQISPKTTSTPSKRRHSKISPSTTSSGLDNVKSKPVHRTNSQRISLPDIIMDFNIEVNMAANDQHNDTLDSDSEKNERIIGASYEKYLKPKLSVNNPYNAKHRPVTPGLLDSLNKLKLPSKVKTERWLKDSQTAQKSYCAGSYRVGNLHNSNLVYPNWIYTDS